jgi:predicted dehydrogenase
MVATHWRHSPVNVRVREIVTGDGFGEANHCHGRFYAPGPAAPMPAWGAETGFDGFLLGQGVHLMDCTRFLMGDIASVSAELRGTDERFDSCSVSLQFTSGATGGLSLVAHAPYWIGHRIFGSKGGVVEVENNRSLRMSIPPLWTGEERQNYESLSFQTWENTQNMPGHTGGGYLEELTHFAESLLEEKQPSATLEDGFRAMQVLEAIRESAYTRKRIELG